MITKEEVTAALKEVIDPEIGINLVDLGMIKDIEIKEDEIKVKMVLTSPFCPLVNSLTEQVKKKAEGIAPGTRVTISILDEPWLPPERMKK